MAKFIKQLKFGLEARDKVLKGMNILADAVGSTLGPRSRNVAVDFVPDQDFPPKVLHDGVSVARSINLQDPFEDMGVRLLKDASMKTNEKAGDGTTTSTIIAQALVNEAFKNITAGANPMLLKAQIEEALKVVLAELKKLAIPVSTDEELQNVATISAADPEIGKLVAEAVKKVGQDGVITIEEGKGFETTVEYKEGMEIDRGYATTSPYFRTESDKEEAVIEDPYILLTDKKINYQEHLIPFLDKFLLDKKVIEKVNEEGETIKEVVATPSGRKNLVIFAGEVLDSALHFLVVNKLGGKLNVLAVQAPAFGDRRVDELHDIATLTGGVAVLEDAGRQLETVEVIELGRAEKVIANRDSTVIIGGKGEPKAIKAKIESLREEIKTGNTQFDKDIKAQRLAKLVSGLAVINVGAATEVELKEKKERVIDAKSATKAAQEEGIVAGGEITLLKIAEELTLGTLGAKILKEALKAPFKRLVTNSGLDYADVKEKMSGHKYPDGIDVIDGEIKDLIKAGVIDPVKVTRFALENACSVACMAMTTDTLITDYIMERRKND